MGLGEDHSHVENGRKCEASGRSLLLVMRNPGVTRNPDALPDLPPPNAVFTAGEERDLRC